MKRFIRFITVLFFCWSFCCMYSAIFAKASSDIFYPSDFGVNVAKNFTEGDKILYGLNVAVIGATGGDVLILAGSGQVSGQVYGDIRVLAGDIIIDDNVGGNVTIAAANVTITNNALIDKNIHIFADKVVFDGILRGNASIWAGSLEIGGNISGDLYFDSGNKEGDVLKINPGGKVSGKVVHKGVKNMGALPAAGYTHQKVEKGLSPIGGAVYDSLRIITAGVILYLISIMIFKFFPRYGKELGTGYRKKSAGIFRQGVRFIVTALVSSLALIILTVLSFFFYNKIAAILGIFVFLGIFASVCIMAFIALSLMAGSLLTKKLQRPAAVTAMGLPIILALYLIFMWSSVLLKTPLIFSSGVIALIFTGLFLGGGKLLDSAKRLRDSFTQTGGTRHNADLADTGVFEVVPKDEKGV